MDHLAQDLTVALEESEPCGNGENSAKWSIRRRTRSAGNLYLYFNKSYENNSDESSSSPSERRVVKHPSKLASFHQSDSDDMSISAAVAKALSNRNAMRNKEPFHGLIRGISHSLESDSVNEHSPARPNLRRKRKLKRMSIDETPVPQCGKRKRSQRMEIVDIGGRTHRHSSRIKPLHQSLVDKIEKFCHPSAPVSLDDPNMMEIQNVDDNCEVASESSISWSGGEGHEGDDELTDWAPPIENSNALDQSSWNDSDPREIRAGCRRLSDERRPGFSINTGANERVAKFLQDSSKSEIRVFGVETKKIGQLAALYSLDLLSETPSSIILRKTNKTPCMQPTQRHHSGWNAIHKRIRTHNHHMIS